MRLDLTALAEAQGSQHPGDIAATLRGLPHMTHTTGSWVTTVLRGLTDPTEQQATALAAALGVSLYEIAAPAAAVPLIREGQ
jgi:hypothetical protein